MQTTLNPYRYIFEDRYLRFLEGGFWKRRTLLFKMQFHIFLDWSNYPLLSSLVEEEEEEEED